MKSYKMTFLCIIFYPIFYWFISVPYAYHNNEYCCISVQYYQKDF